MRRILLPLSLVIMAALLLSTGCGGEIIRVSSWPDSEGTLIAQIMVLILRENGFRVIDMVPAGSDKDVHHELKQGRIDIYPEYTPFYIEDDLANPQNGIIWLKPAPADSKWAIVISMRLSRDQNIKTMSDFSDYVNSNKGEIKLICSSDFITDKYALPNFEQAYGFSLNPDQLVIVPSNNHVYMGMQVASTENDINAAMAYTTDGYLEALNLVALIDDKSSQPNFNPAPLVRKVIFDKHADRLNRILTPLFDSLDDKTLRYLNSQIGLKGKQSTYEVARQYLIENGYFKYNEAHLVQKAMDEMMKVNGLNTVTPRSEATSDMSIFPDKQHALYSKNMLWPYMTWRITRGTYSCDSSGIVTQVTTGW